MESPLLQEIIKLRPSTWVESTYRCKRYERFQVSNMEYENIRNLIPKSIIVKKIERVQNPYLYGQFLMRREQMQMRGPVYQIKAWKIIPVNKVDILCEFNYDIRHIYNRPGSEMTFTTSVSELRNVRQGYCIIAFSVLSMYDTDSIECKRDADFYPEYIIYTSNV